MDNTSDGSLEPFLLCGKHWPIKILSKDSTIYKMGKKYQRHFSVRRLVVGKWFPNIQYYCLAQKLIK